MLTQQDRARSPIRTLVSLFVAVGSSMVLLRGMMSMISARRRLPVTAEDTFRDESSKNFADEDTDFDGPKHTSTRHDAGSVALNDETQAAIDSIQHTKRFLKHLSEQKINRRDRDFSEKIVALIRTDFP